MGTEQTKQMAEKGSPPVPEANREAIGLLEEWFSQPSIHPDDVWQEESADVSGTRVTRILLLDTMILSALLRRDQQARVRLESELSDGSTILMSPVVYFEIRRGLLKMWRR